MKNFYKNISLILFFLILIPKISYSEIVNKIEIIGNERISKETIKMFSKINIGDNINENDVNEILKRIYNSTFFEDVKVSIKENTLSIVVFENPLVENVEIKGPKAKKIVEELKKNLKVKARTSYNEILFLEDKKKIIEILKQKGYFFSNVDVVVEKLSDNKVNLIYNVEIGDKNSLVTFHQDL